MRNKSIMIYLLLSMMCIAQNAWSQSADKCNIAVKDSIDNSTFAISTVNGDDLLKSATISPANTLYGRLNGLTVLQNGGYGGTGETDPKMYIRGMGTLNDNSMLVLVDGLERPLSSLVTEEIESVSVLKDAASLALYGLRGANGVLLVKTKRGEIGRSKINVSYHHTFTTPFRMPKFANAATYAEAVNEGRTNEGLSALYNEQEINAYRSGKYPTLFPDVNWVKETLRDVGARDQVNLTASGGNEKVRYFALINFAADRGLIKNANMNDGYTSQLTNSTMNVRTNLDMRLTSTTQMSVNLMGKLREMNRPGAVTDANLMYSLYNLPANAYPVKTDNGTWGGGAQGLYPLNPVAQSSSTGYAMAHARGLYADMELVQNLDVLTKGLKARFRIGFDAFSESWDSRSKQYLYEATSVKLDPSGVPGTPIYTQYGKDMTELSFSTQLGGQSRHSNLQFGLDYEKNFSQGYLSTFLLYKQDKQVEIGQFNTFMHQDIVAGVHYTLANRYFFDLSMSASGTSRLPKDQRWGFFPAVLVAWNITNESFMRDISWVNQLKLRASYGLTGNDRITPNLNRYYFQGGSGFVFGNDYNKSIGGLMEGPLASRYVTYEKTSKLNVGLDTRLFNLLTLNIDAFYDQTYDIMVSTQGVASGMLGSINSYEPDGKVTNYGLEIGAKIDGTAKDFVYSVAGQLSFVRNKITNMNESYLPYDYLKSTGRPIGQVFGMEAIGFFKDQADIDKSPKQTFSTVYPGDLKYKDQNKDGKIDAFDAVAMGHNGYCPEIYYSASVDIEYKGIGLSALFQGTANQSIVLNTPGLYSPLIRNGTVSEHYLANCWRPNDSNNANALYPRLTTTESANNYRSNSAFIADASYLKLRMLEVYYKLPKMLVSKCRMSDLKLFVRGMNLFSIDNIKVTDPEFISAAYPTLRSYNLGFNLTF